MLSGQHGTRDPGGASGRPVTSGATSPAGRGPARRVAYPAGPWLRPRPHPLSPTSPEPDPAQVEALAGALLDPSLEPIVEMVLRVDRTGDEPVYEARTFDGAVRYTRAPDGAAWRYDVAAVEGRNPLADQAVDRFSPASEERSNRWPDRTRVSYPFAYEMVSQIFDSPWAPDLICEHTSLHNWEDQGGHRGEHGSPTVVQARAPFVLAGAGVRRLGVIPRACKLIDVAPTVLDLMGGAPVDGVGQNGLPRPDALLRWQDGEVLDGLFDDPRAPAPPRHRLPLRRLQRQRAARDGRAPARSRTWPGSSARGSRSGTGPCRRCRRSPWPTTPASSRARTRATTASSTTPGTTRPRGSRSSPTRPPPGPGRCTTSTRPSRPCTRR